MISTKKAAELLRTFQKSVGLELEFNVVDRKTLEPASLEVMRIVMEKLRQQLARQNRWRKFAARLGGLTRPRHGWHRGIELAKVVEELPAWVIEVVTPVCHNFEELRSCLWFSRDIICDVLANEGLALISIDMIPLKGIFRRDYAPEVPTYLREVWDDNIRPDGSSPIQLSGSVTGIHIHHGTYESEEEAFTVLRQSMPLVPMFIGGTANGAIAHRDIVKGLGLSIPNDDGVQEVVDTGRATIRPLAWGQLGHGIGPAFRDEKELWRTLIANFQAGKTDERLKQYYWIARRIEAQWAFKKGALLGTNEFRGMGALPTIADILAWAAFAMMIEYYHRCMYRLGTPRFPYMEEGPSNRYVEQIDADEDAAATGGLRGCITNPFSGDFEGRATVAEVMQQAVCEVLPFAEAMGHTKELEHILGITDGDSYDMRQRRAFKPDDFKQGDPYALIRYHIEAMNT